METRRRAVLTVLALEAMMQTPMAARPAGERGRAPAVCFAPGTRPEVVRDLYERLYGSREAPAVQLFQFQDGNRWTGTATNPGPLTQGDPTTIRWSIVPDGTSIPGSAGEPTSGSTLIFELNAIYGSQAIWLPLFQQAFDRWSQLTGMTYVYEPNDDGAAFPSLVSEGSPGVVGVRGDVRIGGHPIDGDFGILAYNFFPDVGEMVIDVPDFFYDFDFAFFDSLGLRNVVAHEHGHGLGFNHVCPVEETKLMEPSVSVSFDGPQHDDILAGQRGYGDDKETNDTLGASTDLGSLGNGTMSVNGVSADDNGDVDRYKFTVGAGKQVSVTVTPQGQTYLDGPQNMDGSCSAGTSFNSLALNDLGFEVIGADGTTVLASANSQPAGVAESISNLSLGAAGSYSLRVFAGANNRVQLYDFSLTIADSAGGSADLAVTKTDGTPTAVPGAATTYTIVATNAGPNPATGATLADSFPAAVSGVSWTCVASAGSSCGAASGSGNINQSLTVAAGGSVTFTAVATISPSATGTLANTATLAVPGGITDPVPGDNSATDTDTLVPAADLSVTKTDGRTATTPSALVTYTIQATNAGPSAVTGASVSDSVPPTLTGVTWTCAGSGGGSCTASGSGSISDTVNLPVGGTVTYTLSGSVSATPGSNTLINSASVAAAGGVSDPNPANNAATDQDEIVCVAQRVLVADGRVTQGVIGAGATAWFLAQLKLGASYSLELTNTTGDGTVPGALTVYSGDDGCSGTSTLTVRDTTSIEPAASPGTRRVSFTASGGIATFRARLVNSAGASIPHSVSLSETTLYSAAWSTNASFDSFYSFQNTTGSSLSGRLTFFDTAGVQLASFPVVVPAGQTLSSNTAGLVLPRNMTGTARFSHDGPPGAVLVEAAIANFSLSPAYLQPVRFQSVREAR